MKELTTKKILNILTICIIFFVPIVEYISFYMQKFGIIESFASINAAMIMWISIPFLIYVYIKDILDKKRKLDIYDYIFCTLIIVGIIVSVFAINTKISIVGSLYRREGLLVLITYYLLFINWKVNGTSEDIKKYIKLLIILGIINSIYALFQIYTPFKFILRYTQDINMASGLCGNPNFFGSLMVTILGVISAKFLMNGKIKKSDIALLVLFLIALINSQSTGPMLTYTCTIIFLIIFLMIKKKLIVENIIVLVLIIILSFITSYSLILFPKIFSSKSNNSVHNTDEIRCELCDIKETVDTGGNGRLEIWENTLDVVVKNPILGVGYDNLGFAYPNRKAEVYFYVTNNVVVKEQKGIDVYIDNAHNVYLHTLVTSGILGLIPLLILLLYIFIHGLKSNNKYTITLLGGFVAYSIQAFANISVIEVAPIYYIIIGLILSEQR